MQENTQNQTTNSELSSDEACINHDEAQNLEEAKCDSICTESTEATLEEQIIALKAEIAEARDTYVRAQAEVQNVQRRAQEEVKKARDFAISSFARDIVVVKDYLEMALADKSNNVDTIKTGVDLTLKQVVQIFERNYIKEVAPVAGDKLDPNLHQAMNSVETEGREPNTIVEVMQKGYMLNNRVLRPAMVIVTK